MIALDLETCRFGPRQMAPRPICAAMAWLEAPGEVAAVLHHCNADIDEDGMYVIGPLLTSDTRQIIGHNIAYDMSCIGAHYPELLPAIFQAYDENRITDTMIRAKLLDITKGCYRGFRRLPNGKQEKLSYGLGDPATGGGCGLVRRCFGVRLDKDTWRLRYEELEDIPLAEWPEGAREYALDDARWTLKLWELQEEHSDLLEDQYRQARAAFWLRLMSCWGLTTDLWAVNALRGKTAIKIEELARRLLPYRLVHPRPDGGYKRNLAPARVLMIDVCRIRKVEPPKTEAGAIALDDASCRKSGHPALVDYAEFTSATKRLGTDIELLESGTEDPIHARFEELLETGRTSSSPNVQNPPREGGVRECYVPRPGFVFASADFSMLELRTVAQVLYTRFGASTLRDALNAGRDPHTEVACRILGVSYEAGAAMHETEDHDFEQVRAVGKVANFGFPGGLGPTRLVHFALLSYGVTLTEHQARKLKETWLSQWPEFRDYFAWIASEVDRPQPRIRHLYSNRWRGGMTYTAACNSFFQGLGADAAKAAGWTVSKACYLGTPRQGERPNPLLGSRIVNFIHDEFIVEVPEPIGHEAAHELARLMQDAAQVWTPDVAMKVGKPKLMRRWSKDAKAVWKEGRLVAWG
jgi:hypothetical protein